jgi:DNA-binding response OmpR family regulator
MLSLDNYEILVAKNGQEGIEFIERERLNLNLIILDWLLPKVRGEQIFWKIQSDRELQKIPLLVISGIKSEFEERIPSLLHEYFEFLEKPFETTQLIEAIYTAKLKAQGQPPRFVKLSLDNQYRLHAEGSPAIQFADGWSIYAYHGVRLPEKYGKVYPNQWQSQWLLSEENAELRRVLIQGIGYARICQELKAIELDNWQEYRLIKIDIDVDFEPIYLLKMTCPSTGYIHALRVPPDMNSAREAISWVNWGVAPEEFSVQT